MFTVFGILFFGVVAKVSHYVSLASLIGMAAAVPLVMKFTYIGAAITIVISRGLLGTLSFVKAKYYINKTK